MLAPLISTTTFNGLTLMLRLASAGFTTGTALNVLLLTLATSSLLSRTSPHSSRSTCSSASQTVFCPTV